MPNTSWVITTPKGRRVETFDRKTAEDAKDLGCSVENIGDYLARINAEFKRGA